MKKSLLIIVLFAAIALTTNAQMYQTAVGGRLGGDFGVSLKHFTSENNAIEAIASFRYAGGLVVTGLYEIHNPAFDIDNLFWFYGGGIHAGLGYGSFYTSNNVFIAGVDGIIGIEYTFDDLPVNIALDWKPSIDVVGRFRFWGVGSALTVRYLLN